MRVTASAVSEFNVHSILVIPIHLINKTKEEILRRGRLIPSLDPDFIPYWTQNIVCTAV